MSNFCFIFTCLWLAGFTLSECVYFFALRSLNPSSVGYCSLIIFLVTIPASLCSAFIISSVIDRMRSRVRNERTPLLPYSGQIYDI